MKVITRVDIDVKYLIGEDNWAWIKQSIKQWQQKAPKHWEGELKYEVYKEWPMYVGPDGDQYGGVAEFRSLRKNKKGWWIFIHGEDSFSNEWQFRKTNKGWEWNYTTQSGLGHYEYRYVVVGYDSTKGILKEGQLTFEGRRGSLKMGNHFFTITPEKVEAWRYCDYAVPHKVHIVQSSTPDRGAWD